MHITVTGEGTVAVHGSRRLSARLHGVPLAATVESWQSVATLLVSTSLVEEEQAARLLELAAAMEAATIEDWQCALAALCATEEEVAALVKARQKRYTLDIAEVSAQQCVYVYTLEA
jgi:hypothetical protein